MDKLALVLAAVAIVLGAYTALEQSNAGGEPHAGPASDIERRLAVLEAESADCHGLPGVADRGATGALNGRGHVGVTRRIAETTLFVTRRLEDEADLRSGFPATAPTIAGRPPAALEDRITRGILIHQLAHLSPEVHEIEDRTDALRLQRHLAGIGAGRAHLVFVRLEALVSTLGTLGIEVKGDPTRQRDSLWMVTRTNRTQSTVLRLQLPVSRAK